MACRSSARRRIRSTSPKTASVSRSCCTSCELKQPPNGTARTEEEALRLAEEIGYPLVVRPSYVLGGRAMEIVHEPRDLERYMREAVKVSNDSPVLIDRFLDDAIEVDVDCLADGKRVLIGGVMEHIEEAGVHSGDSACSLPPYSLSEATIDELKRQTEQMARALNVVGLMNMQFAIKTSRTARASSTCSKSIRAHPHGAVRFQGDRHAAGEDCGAGHGGHRLRASRASAARSCRRTSRSRRRSSRSPSSRASIRCSGPRCARPAK